MNSDKPAPAQSSAQSSAKGSAQGSIQGPTRGPARGFIERMTLAVAWMSAIALLAMVGVTVLGVVMRYVFDAPILGVNEMTQAFSVALVMLAMPYAAATDAHIRVDFLDKPLGRAGRWLSELIATLIGLAMMYFLIRRSWNKMLDAVEFGDVTNMLLLPLSLFFGLILFGAILYALVLVVQLLSLFISRRTAHD